MRHTNTKPGFSVLELLIAGGALLAVVAVFQVLLMGVNASQRDLRRLADMREAETAFQRLFRSQGSFLAAARGCSASGSLLSSCDFSSVGMSARHLVDPGKSAYRVEAVPTDAAFTVAFRLERAHGTLAAGDHTLTPEGIK